MLPELGVTHALLLQGPAGPFMRRFAEDLEDAGIRATKVNFHAGDVFFYPGPRALSYRGSVDAFQDWVGELIDQQGIDGLFLFGDCRPLHRLAIRAAEAREVRVWCFEEGYLRPDWITLEEHGVNGHSRMPRDPDFYRSLSLPEPPATNPVGARFQFMTGYSIGNALSFTHLNGGFPRYEHHRNLNAWYHTFVWVRNVARKKRWERAERGMLEQFTGPLAKRYYFVPLQVHMDFQMLHSPYDEVLDFIHEVVPLFAQHAAHEDHILFKHHPMDRPFREYGELFARLAREHGIEGRLHYCHDLHLPTLLKHAKATLTINSTVGLQSIHHRTPVKTTGTAIYDMPGLTYQGSVETFFENPRPAPPDEALYRQFRRYLLFANQCNGSFYKRVWPSDRGTGIRWFPGLP